VHASRPQRVQAASPVATPALGIASLRSFCLSAPLRWSHTAPRGMTGALAEGGADGVGGGEEAPAPKKRKSKKRRVDELLVEQGLVVDVKQAAALTLAGKVVCDNVRIDSPALKVPEDGELRLKGQKEHGWVSRGGMKLAHALAEFPEVSVEGVVAIDVGCSTGGFTDVLLAHGAAKIFAVDVGYGQLALKLRNDNRVVVLERTNARNLTDTQITAAPSLVVCDASFIPLRKVLPTALTFCQVGSVLLALIKPQFEAAREEVESGTGVVRDEAVRARVCQEVSEWAESQGWNRKGLATSPIKGPNGNVEFILYAVKEW